MTTPQDPAASDPLAGSEAAEAEPLVFDEDGLYVGEDTEAPAETDALTALAAEVAERTADLQRLQAEYANYRRRVERDREQIREQAVAGALVELLPVLDDVGRARAHDELVGAFKSVGEALEAAVAKLGLEVYGAVGDPFDPELHEALAHSHSSEVTETTCVEVYQPGYRFAGRVVRPARVVVADPAPADGEPTD